MKPLRVRVSATDDPEFEAFLAERIYEFNVAATGIADGRLLHVAITDDAGAIIGGITGHSWGACCELINVWVKESERKKGVGTALMEAAEQEARRRGCRQIVLSTHSFQAPSFYENLGFSKLCAVPHYPSGHENAIYIKIFEPD